MRKFSYIVFELSIVYLLTTFFLLSFSSLKKQTLSNPTDDSSNSTVDDNEYHPSGESYYCGNEVCGCPRWFTQTGGC